MDAEYGIQKLDVTMASIEGSRSRG
jgi:hypothetical protein